MTRLEKAIEVKRLRDEGLYWKQVAARLGISTTYAHALYHDPDGSKDKVRKAQYGRPCVRCGVRTDGSNGRERAPSLCRDCWDEQHGREARERYCREVRRFVATYGRLPAAQDWSPRLARRKCTPEHAAVIAARYERDGWPPASGARGLFGGWNAAIRAAGFTPRPWGVRGPAWRHTAEAKKAA